jgi:hypothetical protein
MVKSARLFFNLHGQPSRLADAREETSIMTSRLANLNTYRRRKANARVFEALEQLYVEVLSRLEDENEQINPEEFEEFMVQVLGDHLVGNLTSGQDFRTLDENYRRFDTRLRNCLQTKMKTLQRFETIAECQVREFCKPLPL